MPQLRRGHDQIIKHISQDGGAGRTPLHLPYTYTRKQGRSIPPRIRFAMNSVPFTPRNGAVFKRGGRTVMRKRHRGNNRRSVDLRTGLRDRVTKLRSTEDMGPVLREMVSMAVDFAQADSSAITRRCHWRYWELFCQKAKVRASEFGK